MPDDPDADGQQDTEGTSPWGRTLEEANAMTDRLRADGWDVVTVRAAHVAPVAPDEGETDRFGLVYVAPDGVSESLPAAVERADLRDYEVFRRELGSELYVLTRLTDPDERVAVLLVGAVDLSAADGLVEAARERGALHSHVELLDGTHLLSVRHDDPGAFFG
ncbi:MAG: hypothetical protein V5A44_09360 [Haloarculaceae archaeon]